MKKVIITHEESQAVTSEFIDQGYDAYSCDLQECSGSHKERHYVCNAEIIDPRDFIFWGAHPDCTYLTNSGVTWLWNKDKTKNIERWIKLEQAMNHFNLIKRKIQECGFGYLENPIPHKYAREGFESVLTGEWVEGIGKYDQLIQPYQFGHLERKATCLWITGLPHLMHTNDVKTEMDLLPKNQSQRIHYLPPGPERAKLRSKTFSGIAKAIADQWSKVLTQ